MRKILLTAAVILLSLSAPAQDTLRLMSYNIRNARGMDGVTDYQRIADVIVDAAPDIVAIQEVDSMTRRSGEKYVLGEIAARTGMTAWFAPAINYDGGKYGIGLLTRQTPLHLETFPLPGREEARTLIVAEFEDWIFCCTHLSLREEDRMASLEIIRSLTSDAGKPVLLAGDMNARPQSDFIRELQEDFEILTNPNRPTFPAGEPKETLDYVAVRKENAGGIDFLSSRVIDEPMASDHRPVEVKLRVFEAQKKLMILQQDSIL